VASWMPWSSLKAGSINSKTVYAASRNSRFWRHCLASIIVGLKGSMKSRRSTNLESKGYHAIREYSPDPNSKDRIDVFAEINSRKVAFEYINKGFQHLEATVQKCLIKMGMEELVIVANTKSDAKEAEEIISNCHLIKHSSPRLMAMVSYKLRSEFN